MEKTYRLSCAIRTAVTSTYAMICLGGCSLAPASDKLKTVVETAVSTGVEDRRSYNDKKAETLLQLPCDISIGAFYRLTNSIQQEALAMLCSGRRIGAKEPELLGSGK